MVLSIISVVFYFSIVAELHVSKLIDKYPNINCDYLYEHNDKELIKNDAGSSYFTWYSEHKLKESYNPGPKTGTLPCFC